MFKKFEIYIIRQKLNCVLSVLIVILHFSLFLFLFPSLFLYFLLSFCSHFNEHHGLADPLFLACELKLQTSYRFSLKDRFFLLGILLPMKKSNTKIYLKRYVNRNSSSAVASDTSFYPPIDDLILCKALQPSVSEYSVMLTMSKSLMS